MRTCSIGNIIALQPLMWVSSCLFNMLFSFYSVRAEKIPVAIKEGPIAQPIGSFYAAGQFHALPRTATGSLRNLFSAGKPPYAPTGMTDPRRDHQCSGAATHSAARPVTH